MTHECKCPGESHPTFGACMRAKNFRVGFCKSHLGLDRTADKNWDKELTLYRDARRQGIQPDSTKTFDIRGAIEHSDKTGVAYGAQQKASGL